MFIKYNLQQILTSITAFFEHITTEKNLLLTLCKLCYSKI